MENLARAVIAVMKEVKGIEKNMTVGTGNSSYSGVADKEVKQIIGASMEKHGLCILPIDVKATTKLDRWEETNQYGVKMKQSVFVEAETKYLLLHESGESVEIAGYGNGVDSQDKAAGKATTYALKYALLYTFLVPTGKIDDADNTHSDDIETPKSTPQATSKVQLPWLNKSDTPNFNNVVKAMKDGYKIADIRKKWSVSKETEKELNEAVNQTA